MISDKGIPVTVELVEELGADANVHGSLRSGETDLPVVARVDGRRPPEKGATVLLHAQAGPRAPVRHRHRPADRRLTSTSSNAASALLQLKRQTGRALRGPAGSASRPQTGDESGGAVRRTGSSTSDRIPGPHRPIGADDAHDPGLAHELPLSVPAEDRLQ